MIIVGVSIRRSDRKILLFSDWIERQVISLM